MAETRKIQDTNDFESFEFGGGHFQKSSYDEHRIREIIPNLKMRDTDLLLLGFAKSGIHWLKYVVMHIFADGDNSQVSNEYIGNKIEYFEYITILFDKIEETNEEQMARWATKADPRIFNTHLHWAHMPQGVQDGKVKVILQVRNPKDTVYSMFKFFSSFKTPFYDEERLDDFVKSFCSEKGVGFGGLNYFTFHKVWWAKRHNIPMLIVSYEDMQQDLPKEIRRVADFLNHPVSDDVVNKIAKLSHFDTMKNCPSIAAIDEHLMDTTKSNYMREGKMGVWKKYLTVAQSEMIDKKFKETFDGTGFTVTNE